jgi:transposase
MPNRDKTWKAAARLEAVITTSAMDEAAKSAWCRRQDVYPSELEKWRNSAVETLAAPEESPASPQQTRQDHPLDKGA